MKRIYILAILMISGTVLAGAPRFPLPILCEQSDIIVLVEMIDTNTTVKYLKGSGSSTDTDTISALMTREFAYSKFTRAYAFIQKRQSITNSFTSTVFQKNVVVPVINDHVTFYGAPEDWHGIVLTGNDSKRWEYDEATFHNKLLKYIDQAAQTKIRDRQHAPPAGRGAAPRP